MGNWNKPDAKRVREKLRNLKTSHPDLPDYLCGFADFLAEHMRDNSDLTPRSVVLAYRRTKFLWMMKGESDAGSVYFEELVGLLFSPDFAEEAIRIYRES